jgi:acyl carrier protein
MLAEMTPRQSQMFDAICGYCRELLEIGQVPNDALFLELGGNSLLATMLANRLEEDHGIRPCIEDILVSSISELADLCVQAPRCA